MAKGLGLGLGVGWESIFHVKSEQLGLRWVSIFHVKLEQYNGFSRGLGLILGAGWGTHDINFNAKKFTNIRLKVKKSCAACMPNQNPRDSPLH